LDVWAGVIPVRLIAAAPVADDRLKDGIPIPPHVSNYKDYRRKKPWGLDERPSQL
jgi:hypothetical protein